MEFEASQNGQFTKGKSCAGWEFGVVLWLGQMHPGDGQIVGTACGFLSRLAQSPHQY